MTITKAPKGGIVSRVNGQFYNGGEFVPDHGKYCGKGRNRVTVVEFAEAVKLAEANGFILAYREDHDDFAISYLSGANYGRPISHAKSLKTLACWWRPGR